MQSSQRPGARELVACLHLVLLAIQLGGREPRVSAPSPGNKLVLTGPLLSEAEAGGLLQA